MQTRLVLVAGRAIECIAAQDLDAAAQRLAEGYSVVAIKPDMGEILMAPQEARGVAVPNLPRRLRQQLLAA